VRFCKAALTAACAFFFAAGMAFIPLLGIENDESLFGSVIFAPQLAHAVRFLGADRRFMLMSYVGSLKGWLYAPIFRLWAPGAYSIRVPVLIAGVLTLWLFYRLVERASSERVAAIAVGLLATDSLYLVTTVFDWGPVALQHLLFVGGMLLGVRYHQERRWWDLAGCFFCFGLGVWDKALFMWLLAGLGVATLTVFAKEILSLLNVRRIGIALAAFVIGAMPLILYNVQYDLATFRSNAKLAPQEIAPKLSFLAAAVEGGVYGWMIPFDGDAPAPATAAGALKTASVALARATGFVWENRPAVWAFVVAVGLMPVLWRRRDKIGDARTMLFCLIASAVAWLLMAITKDAGASIHHIVLFWPLPHWLVALALAAWWPVWGRRIAAIVLVGLLAFNLAIINSDYARMVRNGSTFVWTDAIFGLSRYLERKTEKVNELDWGIHENLTLLNRGRLALRDIRFEVMAPLSNPEFKKDLRQQMASGALFVAHTDGNEIFKGVNANTRAFAADAGFKRDLLATITDSHGKPIYEVFRFEPSH
jgi:hypothetical protein